MHIKRFKSYFLHDNTKEANTFVDTVELGDKGSVQYADGEIIVFYSHFKADNADRTIKQMIDSLKDSIFNTNIRRLSLETDLQVQKETEATEEVIKDIEERIKETDKNLKLYEARIKAFTRHL